MRDRLLKALLVMFMIAAPCLAQTPDDFRRKYGEPETLSLKSSEILVERYTIRRDIMMTVKFADQRRACEVRIEPRRTTVSGEGRAQVMQADEANKLTEELAPAAERGRLIKSSNVRLGCSTVVYNGYERIMIAVAKGCAQQGGGVHSVHIRWKDTACEQIDRKSATPKADGRVE